MRRTIISTLAVATLAAGAAVFGATSGASAAGPSATIAGTVGEDVSTTDSYDGRYLRYVGNPAPDGYADWYQWGEPYLLTESPEDGPVSISGTIDLADMTANGQVAVIGLVDADALRAGDRGDKTDNGIYIARRAGTYRVGVTDGDAGGGEFVQRYIDFPLDTETLDVDLVIDGTADPAGCASNPGDVATADGCLTLSVNGESVSDSYGTIVPTDIPIGVELGSGAHPGWYSAYGAGDGPNVGVDFSLVVSPIVLIAPQTAADCKNGGYEAFDFKNQGLCVASVQANENAGK